MAMGQETTVGKPAIQNNTKRTLKNITVDNFSVCPVKTVKGHSG